MLASVRKIMGRFYRPLHMFSLGLDILFFPTVGFYLHNIRSGWKRWRRKWKRSLYRTGGWLLLRKWTTAFKKDEFLRKLAEAKTRVRVR
jgi:hypothetical protein